MDRESQDVIYEDCRIHQFNILFLLHQSTLHLFVRQTKVLLGISKYMYMF